MRKELLFGVNNREYFQTPFILNPKITLKSSFKRVTSNYGVSEVHLSRPKDHLINVSCILHPLTSAAYNKALFIKVYTFAFKKCIRIIVVQYSTFLLSVLYFLEFSFLCIFHYSFGTCIQGTWILSLVLFPFIFYIISFRSLYLLSEFYYLGFFRA